MPASLKPKAWNLKPELTAAPELWCDSQYFVVPFWGGPGATAITNSSLSPDFSSSGSPSIRSTIRGRSRYYDGSSYDSGAASGFFDGANELTIACYFIQRFLPTEAGGDDEGLFGDGAQVEWNNSRAVQLVSGSATGRELESRFFIRDTVNAEVLGNSNDIVIDQPTTMVGTWSSTNGVASLFCNGRFINSDTGPTASLSSGHGNLIIGSYFDNRGRQIDADFLMCIALDRKWTNDQVKSWSKDPFAMLRPAGF